MTLRIPALVLCAALVVASPLVGTSAALAAPHAAYQPVATSGIPTYKRSHKVGQILFTHDFVEATAKKVTQPLATLSFPQGEPPAEWWGRSYYPATFSEVIKSIGYASRDHHLVDLVYLNGKLVHNSRMDLDKENLGWNTTSWEGADIKAELSGLAPGKHTLTMWRQLNYEVKTLDKATRKVSWEGAHIALSKGSLQIEVK